MKTNFISKLSPDGIPSELKPEEWLNYLQKTLFKDYNVLSVVEIDEIGEMYGKPIQLNWCVIYTNNM
jgi:hypothetical protein